MKAQFECVFIVNSLLPDNELEDIVNKFKELINSNEGEVKHSEVWGRRRLAYPIKKTNRGYYHLYYFTGTGRTVNELRQQSGYDENVLRCFVTKVKDMSVAHAQFVALKNDPQVNAAKYQEFLNAGV